LTNETIKIDGHVLYRICAVRDFTCPGGTIIRRGTLGGWISDETNLSHDGTCWVHDDGKVYGDAKIYGNASVHNHAQVYGRARVFENAAVRDNAHVFGNARIYGYADILDNVQIFGRAEVFGYATARGDGRVCGNAVIDNARLYGGTISNVEIRVPVMNRIKIQNAYIKSGEDICIINYCATFDVVIAYRTSDKGAHDVYITLDEFDNIELRTFEDIMRKCDTGERCQTESLLIVDLLKYHFKLE